MGAVCGCVCVVYLFVERHIEREVSGRQYEVLPYDGARRVAGGRPCALCLADTQTDAAPVRIHTITSLLMGNIPTYLYISYLTSTTSAESCRFM